MSNGSQNVTSLGLEKLAGMFQAPGLKIPNHDGDGFYKYELVESRDTATGEVKKMNIWYGPDVQRALTIEGESPDTLYPHSHPWSFNSTVISGAITEVRYRFENGALVSERHIRQTGETYFCGADEFHLVVECIPGTITRMDCGPEVTRALGRDTRRGDWGYLSTTSGRIVSAFDYKNPKFLGWLRELNPHLKAAFNEKALRAFFDGVAGDCNQEDAAAAVNAVKTRRAGVSLI